MNEANVDHDFDAAVIDLRQGQRKGLLKFGAFVILTGIVVTLIIALTFSVGDVFKVIAGV